MTNPEDCTIPVPDDVPDNAYIQYITIGWQSRPWWVIPIEGGYQTVRALTEEEGNELWKCEQGIE